MRARPRFFAAASLAAFALVATACGTTASNPQTSTSAAASVATKEGGAITIRGCAPQNPLIGSMTGEVCGGNVIDWTSAKLYTLSEKTVGVLGTVSKDIDVTLFMRP